MGQGNRTEHVSVTTLHLPVEVIIVKGRLLKLRIVTFRVVLVGRYLMPLETPYVLAQCVDLDHAGFGQTIGNITGHNVY